MQVEVLIALGANRGRRHANLERAVSRLREAGLEILGVSPWIETLPEGGPPGQRDYLNGALQARTERSADALLTLLLGIERDAGRDRTGEVRHAPRSLDLDLLFYGEETIDTPRLTVPHPRLEDRVFVLEPLRHLVPDRRLPRSGRTVRERLEELTASA